ncbi:hypothetical protein [Paucibacter sp. Y2R2-4]|uniref:hypothetical protein n=1 Tax=Paucibacter sp. Y2R2-4 TaxID=2893553 RepID=UPI0021E49F88|nr:hypothetical protein [Paucibacter sp. Y2R2-4]MCV2352440.1 hypothetical protein [Paucibacter sp. Y2R2-4]
MFSRELAELKQRQLALKLRNIELRSEMQAELSSLARPAGWLGLAGGIAGLVLLLTSMRRPDRASRLLGLTQLALRVMRLFTRA